MAQRVLGELIVKVRGDSSDLNKTITQSESKMTNFANNLNSIGNKMSLFVTAPIVALGAALIKSSADMEMLQTSFEVMLGSADRAAGLMTQLKEMAATTPFETTDLANASKLLLQYGVSVEDLIPTMRMLGDIASGDQQKFQSLGLVMGQIRALGRLSGQDLRQMVSTGFNPLYVISEKTGESMASLTDKMSKGQISYEMVADAMKSATSEGGKFYQGMEKGSKTLTGLLSTLKDDAMEAGRSLVESLLPAIKDIVKTLSGFIQGFGDLDPYTKNFILRMAGLAIAIGPAIKAFQGLNKIMTVIQKHPIILALTALVAIVNGVIGAIDAYNRRYDDMIQKADEHISELKKEKDETNNLVNEYEKLKQKHNLTSQEKIRMTEIEKKLKIAMGDTLDVMEDAGIELETLRNATLKYNRENALLILAEERKKKSALTSQYWEQFNQVIELNKKIIDLERQIAPYSDAKKKDYELYLNQLKSDRDKLKEKSENLRKLLSLQDANIEKLRAEYKLIGQTKDELNKDTNIKGRTQVQIEAYNKVLETAKQIADTANNYIKNRLEEQAAYYLSWASLITNQFGNVFSSLGEALVTGEKGWENFGKAAVGAVAAIIEALSHEFFAKSAGAIADALITAANPFTAWQSPGYWAAAGQYAAAGAGAAIAAGIVRGLAGNIKLGTGGLVMPQAGGVQAILAERGVPEVVIPDQAPIWKMIGDRIASRMSNGTVNNNTYNQIPGNVVLKIGENDFYGALESASRHGKFVIDRTRGLSRS